MSVRKGERDEGNLKVLNESRILISYTHDRVKDRELFSKAERWLLPKDIWDAAIGAHREILSANGIRVETADEAKERIMSEKKAMSHIETLEALVDLCNVKGKIDDKRTLYWISLAENVMVPLKGWLKRDRARYKKYLSGGDKTQETLESILEVLRESLTPAEPESDSGK